MADPIDMDPPRYRKRDTVAIQLTSQLARQAATWLLESHTPRSPSLLGGFEDDELFARELGALLKKAAARERSRGSFEKRIPRKYAHWLAWRFLHPLPRPDGRNDHTADNRSKLLFVIIGGGAGGWRDLFGSALGGLDEVLQVSELCRDAVGKRAGRPPLTAGQRKLRIMTFQQRRNAASYKGPVFDDRWGRRLQEKDRDDALLKAMLAKGETFISSAGRTESSHEKMRRKLRKHHPPKNSRI